MDNYGGKIAARTVRGKVESVGNVGSKWNSGFRSRSPGARALYTSPAAGPLSLQLLTGVSCDYGGVCPPCWRRRVTARKRCGTS